MLSVCIWPRQSNTPSGNNIYRGWWDKIRSSFTLHQLTLQNLPAVKSDWVMSTRTTSNILSGTTSDMDRVKRIWHLSPMRASKVQASLRICAVSPEPPLLAHTSSESRGTFRQKARSLAPLNGWACAVKICHDGMLEDTNSLDGAHIVRNYIRYGVVTCDCCWYTAAVTRTSVVLWREYQCWRKGACDQRQAC